MIRHVLFIVFATWFSMAAVAQQAGQGASPPASMPESAKPAKGASTDVPTTSPTDVAGMAEPARPATAAKPAPDEQQQKIADLERRNLILEAKAEIESQAYSRLENMLGAFGLLLTVGLLYAGYRKKRRQRLLLLRLRRMRLLVSVRQLQPSVMQLQKCGERWMSC